MKNIKICVVGLGYVGLPLAIEFGKKFETIGYDNSLSRIRALKINKDSNDELKKQDFYKSKKIIFTNNINDIGASNFYIITVPTPINKNNTPDLRIITDATTQVAKKIRKNDIVVFESTVFPGFTKDIAVPILEKFSTLTYNQDFFCGYSPERINPGDRKHTVKNIVKVISGSNKKTLNKIKNVYESFLMNGTYSAESIEVAEAAKVIENTQRDLNIALVNELSQLFSKMNLNTKNILDAAGSKWNFLKFKPGLVGGHCIGVDPYYLTYKAKQIGFNPKIILAGRKVNDDMSKFYVKDFLKKAGNKKKLKILILGVTFKENCKDIRNSKVFDIANLLIKKKHFVHMSDPFVNKVSINYTKNFIAMKNINKNFYDGIIVAVGHNIFKKMGINSIKKFGITNSIFYDLKNIF
jgi:UDP-N-acetyl-D-glucosamine/UDP-N-acetyl-D-galactosamine dehydrogenase